MKQLTSIKYVWYYNNSIQLLIKNSAFAFYWKASKDKMKWSFTARLSMRTLSDLESPTVWRTLERTRISWIPRTCRRDRQADVLGVYRDDQRFYLKTTWVDEIQLDWVIYLSSNMQAVETHKLIFSSNNKTEFRFHPVWLQESPSLLHMRDASMPTR